MSTRIIYATFDGIATIQHGIGTQTRAFINAVARMSLPEDVRVSIAFPQPQSACEGYLWSEDTFADAVSLCDAARIALVPLPFTEGRLWTQNAWVQLCKSLLRVIKEFRTAGERVVVLAVDAVFTPLSALAQQHLEQDGDLELVHVLYSSARVKGATHDPAREAWEQIAITAINSQPRVHAADIGASFTDHLRKAYGLSKEPLPFRQSVALDDPELEPLNSAETTSRLISAGIPTSRPLVVAAARSDPIKGLPDLARALPHVTSDVLLSLIHI